MAMIKTYRRDDAGALHYREAWTERSGVRIHEGKVGSKGKNRFTSARSRTWPTYPTATEIMRTYTEEAAAEGFHPVDGDAHGWVVLQVWLASPDLSDPEDSRLFDEGQEALDEYLGWRGVGHYDGNDIGASTNPDESGTVLNLFCKVVDTALGVKVVRGFAREFGVTGRHLVASREPSEDSPYVLAWASSKKDKTFTL
ncbi:hypothetical protein [Pseudactinotalea sp.]|uniref:hypothetical protein n=1 Tax=Pseudactinotalea sp. TaxID=1926260 RepID=UPI003B3ADE6A